MHRADCAISRIRAWRIPSLATYHFPVLSSFDATQKQRLSGVFIGLLDSYVYVIVALEF
jgi:hypothetical protein